MKLGIITSGFLSLALMAGCSSSLDHGPSVLQRAHDVATVPVHAPAGTHLVWCSDASACFESASMFCAPADPTSSKRQHFHPGQWEAVQETGMSFPAMVQVDGGWRMLIRCL